MHLWAPAFPDCSDCPHRLCDSGESEITIPKLGSFETCPKKMLDDALELASLFRVRDLWRHWKTGNMGVAAPEASEQLLSLILDFDDAMSWMQYDEKKSGVVI